VTRSVSDTLAEAGAALVGGHTTLGAETTIGLSITGLLDRDPITLGGGRPGDALILTKALGTGTILAAAMRHRAGAGAILAAEASMARGQGAAARRLAGARAMTDVTGYGLAGHLSTLCEASGCGAEIDPGAIPTLPGAAALAAGGIRSSLWAANRAGCPDLPETFPLLFDPQTSGGLLAAVAPEDAPGLVEALRAEDEVATIIGRLTGGPARLTLAT